MEIILIAVAAVIAFLFYRAFKAKPEDKVESPAPYKVEAPAQTAKVEAKPAKKTAAKKTATKKTGSKSKAK